MTGRSYDIVLYGATGFTGRQAVTYLQANAPSDARWAVAGRDRAKLEKLNAGVPIIVADARDLLALDRLAGQTQVVLSTAGPFSLYSDGLVSACVRQGTDYVDIGGEPTWVRPVTERYDRDAKAKGVRLAPGCGVCSVPADLAVLLLNERLGGELVEARAYVKLAGGMFNGGTLATEGLLREPGAPDPSSDPFYTSPRPPAAASCLRD